MNNKKLVSDFFFNLMRLLLKVAVPAIVLPLVLNRIGPENYGVFSYANSVVSYFSIISVLGIPVYGARAIARMKGKEEISRCATEIFIIQSFAVTLTLIAFYIACFKFFSAEYKMVYLILSLILIANYFNFEWFYTGARKFKFIAMRSMVVKALNVAALLLLLKQGDNYVMYSLITALSSLATGFVNFSGFIPYLSFKGLHFKAHLKPIFVLFGISLTGAVNANIDKTLTGYLVGPIYVGYYAVGFRLTRILQNAFRALNAVIFPRVTAMMADNDEEKSGKLIKLNMDYIMMLSAPIILGLVLYADEIILLFFSVDLRPAVGSLIILTGTIPVIAVLQLISNHIILPRNMDRTLFVIPVIASLTNIIFNLILVPGYMHLGAAVATLMAESAGMIYALIVAEKLGIHVFSFRQLLYPLSSVILLFPFFGFRALGMPSSITLLLLKVSVSAALYFAALLLVRDDFIYKYGRKILKKIKPSAGKGE